MSSFSIGQFSLEYWQSLTEEAQTNLSLGEYYQAEECYGHALTEAQKLIDDLSLSAQYEHSARLYKTACYNLARVCQYQARTDDAFYYHQLAHIQIQQFADKQQLTPVTRYSALQVLDGTIVTLLEYYQQSNVKASKKFADALINEHVAFMEKHNNMNLLSEAPQETTGCGQCEGCVVPDTENAVIH
ncbi:hypothetical protein CW745_09810 [Psychromonas sp. psych-6C06]|uniref:hypothetical protein n=1 Tax=Psychromonas sp. psych-6C06 TaxID=2058089 RepID=UPI000C3260DB|nr:hypothetical protein [Psychromonas sp. psych-6C06]PKF61610.1 hypothetical protein CW745_09810 [Psychromonas sp. psych-6C06]